MKGLAPKNRNCGVAVLGSEMQKFGFVMLERFKPIEHSLEIYSLNIRCVTVYKDEREKRTEQY